MSGLQPITWDGIRRLHKINASLQTAATDIEDFGVGMLDAGKVSEKLEKLTGVSLWKLPKIFDALAKIEQEELEEANKFQEYLDSKRE